MRPILAAVAVLLAVTGCGSGATEGPETHADASARQGTPTTSRDPEPTSRDAEPTPKSRDAEPTPRYTFSLPKGDRSVSLNEAIVYDDLHQRHCEAARVYLDGEPDDPHDGAWEGLFSPRNVLLFQAGVELCRGDVATARGWFDRAETEYGWTGSGEFHVCNLYRSAGSVIRQLPRSDFQCQDGQPPPWPERGPEGHDDPRTTDVDESRPNTPSPSVTAD